MPDVSSIGAVDYAQQYQPQYVQNDMQVPEQYDAYPAYAEEQPKRGGSGLLIGSLAALATAGIGFYFGKKNGAKALEETRAKLAQVENSEAVKNYESVKNKYNGLKNATEDMIKEANDVTWCWYKPWTWGKQGNHKFSIKTMKEKLQGHVDVDAKSEKALEKEAKKAGDKAKDSAKETKKD